MTYNGQCIFGVLPLPSEARAGIAHWLVSQPLRAFATTYGNEKGDSAITTTGVLIEPPAHDQILVQLDNLDTINL